MINNSFPLADINAYLRVRDHVQEGYSWLHENTPVVAAYFEAKEQAGKKNILKPEVVA